MSEQNGTTSVTDRTTPGIGATPPAIAPASPMPRTDRPTVPSLGAGQRTGDASPELDGLRSLLGRGGGSAPSKLQATTRVMNALMGYITGPLGRDSDKLTESDVAAIGSILGILEGLDNGQRR